jgi:hypothetical protein
MDRHATRELEFQLIQLLENGLNDEEMARLRAQLLADREALDHYLRFVTVHAGVRQTCIHTENMPVPDLPDRTETRPVATPASPARPWRHWRRIAAVAAVVMLGLSVLLLKSPKRLPPPAGPVSATLVGVHQALWPAWTQSGFVNNGLKAGRWQLNQGLAQLKLLAGTQIILHAPCDFTLQTDNRLSLHTGRAWIHVPVGAEGFTVTTVGAHLVDYGTEFGVIADEAGQTTAHVFVGSVGIRPAADVDNFEHRMTQGQAATMDAHGIMSPTTRAHRELFVSDLSQVGSTSLPGLRLDMADLVGGGNGFGTGFLDHGLDPGSGRRINRPLSERHPDLSHRYHLLTDNPYIDGVMVPDGRKGINIISSTGLAFEKCPATDGTYYDGIFNGAKMSQGSSRIFHLGKLQGQAYGTPMHPALNMHTNAGITFDLKAIRDSNPGTRIRRFEGLCGISETQPEQGRRRARTEFWVLEDGEVRFHFPIEATESATRLASVDLDEDSRFLTLLTTTAGDSVYAWAFFAQPVLELTLAD